MKTSITILILLVIIAMQLILWAVSDLKRQRDLDRLEERIKALEKERANEMQDMHG